MAPPKKTARDSSSAFFFRLRSLWPQEAKLVQSIDVMPSLAFDEPGRISQHLTFSSHPSKMSELAQNSPATSRWKPGGASVYCSDFPGECFLNVEWRKTRVSELNHMAISLYSSLS